MFSLLNGSSFVFLELRLEMSAAHFDAELRPGPDVPDRSPDDVLVKALHKVTHHRLELLEGLGLDPPNLCLGDAIFLSIAPANFV